jgi:predicted nucleic acid-binding protein
VAALVDTNVLIYSYDARFPEKRRLATALLRRGIAQDNVRVPHQALVEFVSVATRRLPSGGSLLSVEEARREAEEILSEYTVLYPNDSIVRTALRGAAAYNLPWFDAHLWAYAEYYGLDDLLSEDFEHGRLYGSVRVINPFRGASR